MLNEHSIQLHNVTENMFWKLRDTYWTGVCMWMIYPPLKEVFFFYKNFYLKTMFLREWSIYYIEI